MKSDWSHLEKYRISSGLYASAAGDRFGAFSMRDLLMLAVDGSRPEAAGWEHVSVSLRHRCPQWDEMCSVKELFWDEHETVIQFHPAKSEHVNCHPNSLHLWKPRHRRLRLPPTGLVGFVCGSTAARAGAGNAPRP
jgi:hypothetical protein